MPELNPRTIAFFDRMEADFLKITYDDVIVGTGHSDLLPDDVSLRSRFTRNTWLNIPIVSAPMDTVSEAAMAIAMAESGGMSILHRGKGMDQKGQTTAAKQVQNRLHGRNDVPVSVEHDWTVKRVLAYRREKGFAFHSFPVVLEGKMIGLVTATDFEFCADTSQPITSIMTPIEQLVVGPAGISAKDAHILLLEKKKKLLPLVNDMGALVGIYHFADLKRIHSPAPYPHALDKHGHLLFGAAVGVGDNAMRRAEALAAHGCDVFHIDTAHGDSGNVLKTIRDLDRAYPSIDIAAGNVSMGESAVRLADAGSDNVMVGQGPGSICTTQIVAGTGAPQMSAVYECVKALKDHGHDVPVCADGGIRYSGNITAALCVGAESVMLGGLLAGTEESPGEKFLYRGALVKGYRGMGSKGAMADNAASLEKYGQSGASLDQVVPEGIEGIVPYRGSVTNVLHQLAGGVRKGLSSNGARTIDEFRKVARISRRTNAGLQESHPHDVEITVEAPNYSRSG